MRKLIVLSFLLLNCLASRGQNKGLDPSFGNRGIARTDIYTNKKFKTPTGLIIQPDGKILTAGNFIARYKTDGTPDSSFATNGFFLPPYTDINYSITPVNARAIALLDDGKILMGGKWDSSCYYIARLLTDGTIDSTFGQNGISRSNRLDVWNILVQSDEKILAIGNGCGSVGAPQDSVFIERFKPDGSLDSSFGRNGYTNANLGNYGGSITNMGVLSDGRIAMGGIGYDDSGHRAIIVLRFLPDGKLDTMLGGTGRIFPFYAWYCHGMAVLPDGRMILSIADPNSEDITRLNTDGSPDTTFGHGGFISIDQLATLSILPLQDGRILCGGQRNGDYAIARLKPNGKGLDSSFGQNGLITTDITGYWGDAVRFLAIQSDSKIVACGLGQLNNNTPPWVYMIRYNANASVGIGNEKNNSRSVLAIVPNPARDQFRIKAEGGEAPEMLLIINAAGAIIHSEKNPLQRDIDVHLFPSGYYFLKLLYRHATPQVLPLVVQH